MRVERLIMTSGDRAVSVRFHERFTVVAGVGPVEREGITSELLGSLRGPRPGTNIEVVTDDAQRVAVLRPAWGTGDRAIDGTTGVELTDKLTTPDGRLDLLAPLGLKLEGARRLVRFGTLDLMARHTRDALVLSLAGKPQAQMWKAATRLRAARVLLESAGESIGATPEDTNAISAVDERHMAYEKAQDRCESIRHHGVFTGMACAIAGVPALMMNQWSAIGFIAVAGAFLAVSVVARRGLVATEQAEVEALNAAGAASYGGFLHQRVAAMIGAREALREKISAAVTEHRKAQTDWNTLVGDVDLDWAMEHQAAIAGAAATAGDSEGVMLATSLARKRPVDARELAELLLTRIAELESVGFSEESLPLILDEPFVGLDPTVMKWLLELLVRASGRPQIVLLTEDPGIVAWARAGEIAGDLSVMSPAPDRAEAGMLIAS